VRATSSEFFFFVSVAASILCPSSQEIFAKAKLSPLGPFRDVECLKLRGGGKALHSTSPKPTNCTSPKLRSNTPTTCDTLRPRRHLLSRDHTLKLQHHNVDAYHLSPCRLLRFPSSPTITAIRNWCYCWHARIAANTSAQSQCFGPICQSWSFEQGTRGNRNIRAASSIHQRRICGRGPAALCA